MRFVVVAAIGLTMVSLAGAQQPRSTQKEAAVPFSVGERLTYDVTYSSYLTAGTATTIVQDRRPSPGALAYYVVVEGKPLPMLANLYKLSYRMDSLIDGVTLLPHRSAVLSEEGARKRATLTRFDRAAGKASFEVHAEASGRLDFDIPPQVQDGLSALYVLRTMNFRPGDTITLPVADEGYVYRVRADAAPPERLTVPLGEFTASPLKVAITDPKGQPAAANAGIWLSNDARRLPLKIQADLAVGSFVLLLRQATP